MKLPQADQGHFNLRIASYDSFVLLVVCGFSSTKLENLFETLAIRLKDNFRVGAVPQSKNCSTAPHYIVRKCYARLSAMEVAADDAQHGFRVFVGQCYFVTVIRA